MFKSSKKNAHIETGVVQEWDDDTATGVAYWKVWYKGVCFGDFNQFPNAYTHLEKLMELDVTRHFEPENKPLRPRKKHTARVLETTNVFPGEEGEKK